MTTRSRADAFARALDNGAPERREGALLDAFATLRSDLEPALVPSLEWRSALRTRLLAVAAMPPASEPNAEPTGPLAVAAAALQRVRVPRRAAVLAGALAFVVTVTGIGVGATRSLPGQPLYAAKLATEALQLRLADGALGQGSRHLQFAETRLREVAALASGRGSLALPTASTHTSVLAASAGEGPIGWALADMDAQTRTGSELVQRVARDSGSTTLFLVLQQWSGEQADRLRSVVPDLPGAARQQAQTSLSVIIAVGADAGSALVKCLAGSGTCPPALGSSPKGPSGKPTGRGPVTSVPAPDPAAPGSARPGAPVSGGPARADTASGSTPPDPGLATPGAAGPGLADPSVAVPDATAGGAGTGGSPTADLSASQLSQTAVPTTAPPVAPDLPPSPGPADPTGLVPTLVPDPPPTATGAPGGVLPGR